MKLIITGATGFVATEVVRQALIHPVVTEVVAVARKPVTPPPGTDAAKLTSVVVSDYGTYSAEARRAFTGASACIWTVAITPHKLKAYDREVARKICQDDNIAGLDAMYSASPERPFRFLYMSGLVSERDVSKTLWIWSYYRLMRGEAEKMVIKFGDEHMDDVQVAVTRPGYITPQADLAMSLMTGLARVTGRETEGITLPDLAVAMIEQVLRGFDKDLLWPSDLLRVARAVRESKASVAA